MAFYDNWGKRIQQTGQGAVDWTKRNTEVLRLNGTVSGLEKEIASQYTEIGRIYYQKHAADEKDPDLVPYFQAINEKLKTIEDCKAQISDLKGYRKCIKCGKEISGTAVFCNYCGERQVPEYTASPSERTCPKCGAALKEDQVFCTECGERVEAVAPEQEVQRRCTQCGAILEKDALYCTNCGQKNEVVSNAAAKDSFDPEMEVVNPDPQSFAPEPELEDEIEPEPASVPEPKPISKSAQEPSTNPEPTPEAETEAVAATEGEEEIVRFCVKCGAPLADDDLFCTECGQKAES